MKDGTSVPNQNQTFLPMRPYISAGGNTNERHSNSNFNMPDEEETIHYGDSGY
jgi:hypothetical protein